MRFVVNNQHLISPTIEILMALYVVYIGYLLQRRRQGKETPQRAPVVLFFAILFAAATFMFAVTALHLR